MEDRIILCLWFGETFMFFSTMKGQTILISTSNTHTHNLISLLPCRYSLSGFYFLNSHPQKYNVWIILNFIFLIENRVFLPTMQSDHSFLSLYPSQIPPPSQLRLFPQSSAPLFFFQNVSICRGSPLLLFSYFRILSQAKHWSSWLQEVTFNYKILWL